MEGVCARGRRHWCWLIGVGVCIDPSGEPVRTQHCMRAAMLGSLPDGQVAKRKMKRASEEWG